MSDPTNRIDNEDVDTVKLAQKNYGGNNKLYQIISITSFTKLG